MGTIVKSTRKAGTTPRKPEQTAKSKKDLDAIADKLVKGLVKSVNKPKPAPNYEEDVLATNKRLKENCNKLGFALKVLLSDAECTPRIQSYLKKVQKDELLYKSLETGVRKTKSGHFRPFYVLQYAHKNA